MLSARPAAITTASPAVSARRPRSPPAAAASVGAARTRTSEGRGPQPVSRPPHRAPGQGGGGEERARGGDQQPVDEGRRAVLARRGLAQQKPRPPLQPRQAEGEPEACGAAEDGRGEILARRRSHQMVDGRARDDADQRPARGGRQQTRPAEKGSLLRRPR